MVISRKKKILIIFLSIVVLLMLFGAWYQYRYSMEEAVTYELNTQENTYKLLIATQGSEFKDKITNSVINNYKKDSLFIKVIDISALSRIEAQDYNAILLIHTWENWKPPAPVKAFIDRTSMFSDKIVVLTTSGEGSYKMDDIDAITGESKLENVIPYTNRIIERIDRLLNIDSN